MVSTVSSPASQLAYPTAVELAVAFSVEDNEDLWRKRFDNRFDLFVSAQAVTERLGYDFSPRRTALLVGYFLQLSRDLPCSLLKLARIPLSL